MTSYALLALACAAMPQSQASNETMLNMRLKNILPHKVTITRPATVAEINKGLLDASGLTKPIPWVPVAKLSATTMSAPGCYLDVFKPSSMWGEPGVGLMDLVGAPGGVLNDPDERQSSVTAHFYVSHPGKRYALIWTIWRYADDAGEATFKLFRNGQPNTKKLTGSGTLYFSFVPTASGKTGVMLKESSPGRFLLNTVEIRRAQ